MTAPETTAAVLYTDGGNFQYPQGRHLDGSNFLMVDGHVKWLKGSAVSTGIGASSETAAQDAVAYAAAGTANATYAVTFSPT